MIRTWHFSTWALVCGLLPLLAATSHGQPVAPKPRFDAVGDPLPPGALARLGTLRFRHGDEVKWLAFTPDGKRLFSFAGGDDVHVRIWEVATGKVVHQYPIAGFARLSPDGRHLVTPAGTNENEFLLRDARTGKAIRRFGYKSSTMRPSKDFCFSPDGRFGASLDNNRLYLHLWHIATGKEIWRTRITKTGGLYRLGTDQIVFSPNGQVIATVDGHESKVRLWNAKTGRRMGEMIGSLAKIQFSPNSKFVATSGDLSRLVCHLCDIESGRRFKDWSHKQTGILSLAFSPDSKLLATGDYKCVRVWNPATRQQIRRLPAPSPANFLTFTNERRVLVYYWKTARVTLWDAPTGEELLRIATGSPSLTLPRALLSPDKKTLALTSSGSIVLVDLETGRLRHNFPGTVNPIFAVALSAKGKRAVVAENGLVRRWDVTTGKEVQSRRVKKNYPNKMSFLAHGKYLVHNIYPHRLHLQETITGKKVLHRPKDDQHKYCHALSDSGNRVLWQTKDNALWVESLPDGKEIYRLSPVKTQTYYGVALSANGVRFAYCGTTEAAGAGKQRYTLQVIDSESERRFPPIHAEHLFWNFALSPKGRHIAAYFERKGNFYVHVWDVATGKHRFRFGVRNEKPTRLLFSPSGDTLAVATKAGRLELWDMTAGIKLARWTGHHGPIKSLCFSADGRRLISGSDDTTALVWDVAGVRR